MLHQTCDNFKKGNKKQHVVAGGRVTSSFGAAPCINYSTFHFEMMLRLKGEQAQTFKTRYSFLTTHTHKHIIRQNTIKLKLVQGKI